MKALKCINQSIKIVSVFFIINLYSPIIVAAEDVITDDGREVKLRDDGSWDFISDDRYANTSGGRRVRLKSDNTWEYIGNAPIASNDQVRSATTDIKLEKAIVEIYKEKVHRNKRVITQTLFYINVDVSPLAATPIIVGNNSQQLITITDNKKGQYPVLSMSPANTTIEPGSKKTFIIKADGSPQWWEGARTLQIVFSSGLFGNEKPIKLSYFVDDIQKVMVEKIEKK